MSSPLEVFCCYAHEDQAMLEQLKKQLILLQRQGQITIWSDTDLNAGVEWEKELHQHLESADIFLLLISPDFMASDYCYGIEMQRAIQRHNEGSARVIPVLLRPAFLQGAPFAELQMVPTHARPVTQWRNRDDAFHDIATRINRVVTGGQAEQDGPSVSRRKLLRLGAAGAATIVAIGTGAILISHLHSSPGSSGTPPVQTATPPQGSPATSLTPTVTLTGHTGPVRSVAWSPNGKYIASAGDDTMVWVWNWETNPTASPLIYYGQPFQVFSVAWSPDSKQLVSGGGDQRVQVCNVTANNISGQIGNYNNEPDPGGYISSVAWSPDGEFIADGGFHCKVWHAGGGSPLLVYQGHSKAHVNAVAWSPDRKSEQIASAGDDETVRVWNASDGRILFTSSHAAKVLSVTWSPDGKRLASANSDRTVRVWDANTPGENLRTYQNPDEVYAVSWSPDSKRIAVGTQNGTIQVWQE